MGLGPNWDQSPGMVPKSPNFAFKSQTLPLYLDTRAKPQAPNSVFCMFPIELHHLTATPAKPKSDDNVLSPPLDLKPSIYSYLLNDDFRVKTYVLKFSSRPTITFQAASHECALAKRYSLLIHCTASKAF